MVPIKKTVALSETMPSYQTTLVAPAGTYPWQLLIRFYAPWGDGTPEGWQTPLTPPAVLVNGVAYSVDVAFSYQQNYMSGQPSPGYDQHEQCYAVFIGQAVALKEEMEITVSGEFQQVGYMSATLYFSSLNTPTLPVEVIDNEMTAIPEAENPYISGHPSVFSYGDGNADSGRIDLYRPDKVASLSILPDEVAEDGCSKGYLYANKDEGQEVLILRINVPQTFIHNATPDTIFGDYQCRELTVSAHPVYGQPLLLDFWSVSSRMLNDFIDEQGYAYVFFGPNDYVQQQVIDQQSVATRPPVMTWGNYTGYLLGDPSGSLIIRYRDPADDWIGNPANAVCYLDKASNQPVTKEELGNYLPELYGDTLANFEAGYIGNVVNNKAWPR